jgi:uncharacterized protein (DUF924 family)
MAESDPRAAAVLEFWFGTPPLKARTAWFRKDDAFDAAIRSRFGGLIDEALAGSLEHWRAAVEPALALILVLDQFTRNAFRDTPRAFSGDPRALSVAQELVARGMDRELVAVQRWFVYLPFEHSEDRAAQAESMRLFGQLADADPSMADALEWARRHQQVVERFGRFPHRNEVLGRPSTPAEIEFLAQPGSRF